jgi:hypothetical protein
VSVLRRYREQRACTGLSTRLERRACRLGLGEHDNSRHRCKNHTADGEKGDCGRGQRCGLAALKRPGKRVMAAGSDDEQGEREHGVAATEYDVWRRGGVE